MEAATSLMELLGTIQDPRRRQGTRHPLPALLGLAVVAMLAGQFGYAGIVQYGKERGWSFLKLLGFTTRHGLCKATYSRVFRRIDVAAFERAVAFWLASRLETPGTQHIALDGKTLRGSRDGQTPAAHLLAAYITGASAVVGQMRVDAKTNEHKAALELLGVLPLEGRVVTVDAMFTHRDVCASITREGGDFIMMVKENQPTLLGDIQAAFAEPPEGLSPPSRPNAAPRASSRPLRSTRDTAGSRNAR